MYDHEEEVHQVFGTATGAPLSTNAECAAMKLFDNEVLATLDRIGLGIDAGSRIYRARRTSRL